MSTITIGFSKSKHKFPLISWLIMLCEKTNFSHTYFKIYSQSLDRNLIYQATGSGVFFIGEKLFKENNIPVEEYQVPIDDESKKAILQWAIDESGKQYGRMQLCGIFIKRICKLFGFNIKNPFPNENGKYICSELVLKGISHLNNGDYTEMDFDSVGLNEVRNYAKKMLF